MLSLFLSREEVSLLALSDERETYLTHSIPKAFLTFTPYEGPVLKLNKCLGK